MTTRGHVPPDDEPGRPARHDGQSMAYQLTALGISVLALLRARPMHGYEMFQTLVERHADRIVKVRPGSLYHVVDRLTEEKLIRRAATIRDGRRPERAVYEITDAGAEALQQRVGQLIGTPVNEFPQFAVALAEIDTLGDDAAVDSVGDRVGALEAQAAEIMAIRDVGVTPAGYLAAFDYLLAMVQAELTWLRSFADSMRSGRPERQQTDGVGV
ncbi:PadR family transcriptional regulator [Mycobacterium cookii]|uniref:PadR family transcriptional regulator n=1 Tax=Mycobacterium cookii TaxID=1775 RepID=A0A7I7KVD1_9MYCO|nr:PadR family transcriptional regulator [Mycobacterium cookii]MCV7331434.1 PadR family transcriptional regulator [Mycobacterium cookii]BBX45787.1 PadR family transcriptional regulator [Mycobacterium cookii]